jgi:hypothetical protein
MSNFVASLDEEIERLQEAVEKLPEVKQLRELRRVRALYGLPDNNKNNKLGFDIVRFEASLPKLNLDNTLTSGLGMKGATGRKPSPERVRAKEFIRKFLSTRDIPVRTADIFDALKKEGIDIGGNSTDPVNNLSAMISGSGEFKAHGRSGWTLKTPAERVAEQPG